MTDNSMHEPAPTGIYGAAEHVDHDSFAKAARTGRLIKGLKYVLPVIALCLFGLFLYLSGAFTPPRKIETDKYLAEIDNIQLKKDSAKLHNLKLVGRNSKDGNYELTAGTATRKINEPDRYYLEQVDAVMNKTSGGWAKIQARTGVYDKKTDLLKLKDKVEIKSDKGYVARMAAARVKVSDGYLVSEAPVVVDLPDGKVRAGHMEVRDRGKVFRFTERPKMVINMSQGGKKQ